MVIISSSLGLALLLLGCGFMCIAKSRHRPQQIPQSDHGEWPVGRNEYPHIWETPLPQPSGPTLSSNHDSHSYMSDPIPDMRGSVGHGSDLSYCTKGRSHQNGKYNTPMYYVLDREAVRREMESHFQNTLPAKRGGPRASDATDKTL